MHKLTSLMVLMGSACVMTSAFAANSAKVMVMLPPGFEEGETVEILDVLRRGGYSVDAVSIAGEQVSGAHKIEIKADRVLGSDLKAFQGYDMIVLPGGWTGVDNLAADRRVLDLVRYYRDAGKWVAAMCAAPNVLAKAGVIEGKTITAYPGKKTEPFYKGANYVRDTVVIDGKMVTSRGPGTALPFAFALVDVLGGDSDFIKGRFLYNEMKLWPDWQKGAYPAEAKK
jgi:4-methyl-5(b-hydroxyethyl)-thiazole monophosphate biosynthesis